METFYTLKLSASLPFARSTLYKIKSDSPVQSYSQFCALKQYSEVSPRLWEIVNISLDGRHYSFLVDEEGLVRDDVTLPVNSIATQLYSAGFAPIVGDVFVVVPRDCDLYWMTKKELEPWEDFFEHALCPNIDPYITWRVEELAI